MKRFIIGLLLCAISPTATLAQKLTVKATDQRWSGGIAGRSGSNTSITIKSDKRIIIDSLYLMGMNNNISGFALTTPCNGGWYLKVDSLNHAYYISKSEAHTERLFHQIEGPDEPQTKNKKADTAQVIKCSYSVTESGARQFSGAGLITFIYRGKKQCVVIKEIKELPSVAYP